MRRWSSEQTDAHQASGNERKFLLLVSSSEEDHTCLERMVGGSEWTVRGARSCREARVLMSEQPPEVVICERELLDGNWQDILDASASMKHRPALIVNCRLADEYLWVGVLNLGGYDVLAKPLDRKELLRVINSAWKTRDREWRQAEDSRPPSHEQAMVQISASENETGDAAPQPERTNQILRMHATAGRFGLLNYILALLISGLLVGVLYLGSLLG